MIALDPTVVVVAIYAIVLVVEVGKARAVDRGGLRRRGIVESGVDFFFRIKNQRLCCCGIQNGSGKRDD